MKTNQINKYFLKKKQTAWYSLRKKGYNAVNFCNRGTICQLFGSPFENETYWESCDVLFVKAFKKAQVGLAQSRAQKINIVIQATRMMIECVHETEKYRKQWSVRCGDSTLSFRKSLTFENVVLLGSQSPILALPGAITCTS